jgi:hypothetical protein
MADSAHRCSSSDGPGHSEFETKRQLLSLDLGVVLPPGGGCLASSLVGALVSLFVDLIWPPGGGCLASSLVGALVSFVYCLRFTSRWRVSSQLSGGSSCIFC